MKKYEIKDCPFCGMPCGQPELCSSTGQRKMYRVGCDRWCTSIKRHTIAEAVADWNMRDGTRAWQAKIDELTAENAALRQQIEASQKRVVVATVNVFLDASDYEQSEQRKLTWTIPKNEFRGLGVGKHELYASPVVPAQQEPVKSIEFLFRHKSSGQEVIVEVTRNQIIDDMDYQIRDGLSEVVCQCESIGETNVVECNCEDYAEGFELVTQSEVKPS